jgi:hypothetical protein
LTDRRIQRLTPGGFRLFFNALMWAVANKTDGVLEPDDLVMVPGYIPGLEDELATTTPALWTWRDETWFITEFIDTQTTRAEHEALASARKSKRESQARWRAKQTVDATETSHVEPTTQDRTGVVTASAVTTSNHSKKTPGNQPSSPGKSSRKSGTSPARAKAERATRLPEDWQPTRDVIERMKAQYPTINLRGEFQNFQNHHIGKGTKWVDWNRAWWNWIAEAARRQGTAHGRNGSNGSSIPTSDLRVLQGEALKAQIRSHEGKELESGH